ncbi:MAG: hypothetical protein ACJA0N_002271 [Pseudohongiellaceae bacterium]|jgi:hypothetical protein
MTVEGMTTEAIIFFGDPGVIKEMLYPEFEAILDHVVGIPEFAGQKVPAAYLRLNQFLQPTGAVLFYCSFDAAGNADAAWNLPLQHLAEKGGRGPDLGAGQMRLSCRSQCAVSWHQRELWDPDTDAKPSTFEKISGLLRRNRLGLAVEKIKPVIDIPVLTSSQQVDNKAELDGLRKELYGEFKKRQAELLDEQKLRIETLKSGARELVEKLHRHYRTEASALKDANDDVSQQLLDQKNKNRRYKETLAKQAQGLHDERASFQQSQAQAKTIEADQIHALEQKFEQELQATVDTATAELKEMLEMRDVELFYREEQVGGLRDEITQLRNEKQVLMSEGGDQLLGKLVQSGITFVAYQPGLDHLAIPQMDLFAYLESPVAYVANKYGVDEALYEQWLAHYQLPVCQHEVDDSICGEPVNKIDHPADYIPNDSDRCSHHDFAASNKKEQA